MALIEPNGSQNKNKHHDPGKGLEVISRYVEKIREGIEKEYSEEYIYDTVKQQD